MTLEQAFKAVAAICESSKLTKQEHLTIDRCLEMISNALFKKDSVSE